MSKPILDKARALMADGSLAFRSCHRCNPAHSHFADNEDCVIACFACGHYWLGGHDLTEIEGGA